MPSNRFRPGLLGALLAVCSFAHSPVFALEADHPAPAFALPDADGKTVALGSFAGQVVYLDFWASWCGPCRESFPWMNEMQAQYGEQGLTVLAVNVDRRQADAQAFLAKLPAGFQVVFDASGKTPATYGILGMPTSFLIGRDGRVISQHTSFRSADADELETQIRSALAAEASP